MDGECGFVGGHNVGVEYLGEKPPLAPWRDTHMELRGPAVACLQESFAEDWYWATHSLPPLILPPQYDSEGALPGGRQRPGGCPETLLAVLRRDDQRRPSGLDHLAVFRSRSGDGRPAPGGAARRRRAPADPLAPGPPHGVCRVQPLRAGSDPCLGSRCSATSPASSTRRWCWWTATPPPSAAQPGQPFVPAEFRGDGGDRRRGFAGEVEAMLGRTSPSRSNSLGRPPQRAPPAATGDAWRGWSRRSSENLRGLCTSAKPRWKRLPKNSVAVRDSAPPGCFRPVSPARQIVGRVRDASAADRAGVQLFPSQRLQKS